LSVCYDILLCQNSWLNLQIKDLFFSHSTQLLAATTLRNVLGTKNLAEILSERETISHIMQTSLDEATDPWGVKVERVEMLVIIISLIVTTIEGIEFYLQQRCPATRPTPTSHGS